MRNSKVAAEKSEPEKESKFKKPIRSPLKMFLDYRARVKLEEENRLLKREESMKQDLETFLMELEERRTWVASELKERAYLHLVRKEKTRRVKAIEDDRISRERIESMRENGLCFFRGNIVDYKRWQNSPSKHLDLKGHMGAVYSCKLSKCLRYVVSASADKSVRLWSLSGGKCLITYFGHTKRVTDCDVHPHFEIDCKSCMIISCGGDCTVRMWSSYDDKPLRVLRGHAEAVKLDI
jgi:hypothetical protein